MFLQPACKSRIFHVRMHGFLRTDIFWMICFRYKITEFPHSLPHLAVDTTVVTINDNDAHVSLQDMHCKKGVEPCGCPRHCPYVRHILCRWRYIHPAKLPSELRSCKQITQFSFKIPAVRSSSSAPGSIHPFHAAPLPANLLFYGSPLPEPYF